MVKEHLIKKGEVMKETRQEKTHRIIREQLLKLYGTANKTLSVSQEIFEKRVIVTVDNPIGISESLFLGKTKL